ncbi:MAG: hypothetical protein M3130_03695 [Actinomycetota bacterium]|nr:hypothetical protein [Actinomycetota bacterium]
MTTKLLALMSSLIGATAARAPDAIPRDHLIGDVAVALPPGVVLIDGGADSLALILKVAR